MAEVFGETVHGGPAGNLVECSLGACRIRLSFRLDIEISGSPFLSNHLPYLFLFHRGEITSHTESYAGTNI